MKLVILASVAVAVTACGRAKDSFEQVHPQSEKQAEEESDDFDGRGYSVATKGKLAPCNDKRDGSLVRVRDESKFYVCDDSNWKDIDLNGAKGDKGKGMGVEISIAQHCGAASGQLIRVFKDANQDGLYNTNDGDVEQTTQEVCNGVNGSNGTNNKMALHYQCSITMDNNQFNANEVMVVQYQVYKTTAGDVSSSYVIARPNVSNGGQFQGPTVFYPAGHAKASTVESTYRLNLTIGGVTDPGIFTSTFNFTTKQATMKYRDTDQSSLAGSDYTQTWTSSCTETVSN